jgi:phage terminase large subunit
MPVAPERKIVRPVFYGGALDLMFCRDMEVCLDGPAGTGKTIAALNKIHLALLKYPGARALIARKTNVDLAASALVTYRTKVQLPGDGVEYFGGNRVRPPAFQYQNGSEAVITGLDKPDKVKSAEYDIALINEATECNLDDLETVRSRMRNGVMPYQQVVMDVNPSFPTHWLNQRMNSGLTTRLLSRHIDNPAYWDREKQEWTPAGQQYVETVLSGLTGVRYQRLVEGRWVSAEGIVYEEYDPAVHLIKRFEIPREWPRYIVIDFGFTNPCCIQWWAMDPDGRLYRYRELYMTKRTVDEHAAKVKAVSANDPLPRAVIADPEDADGRAVFSRVTGWSTLAAHKDIENGIQAVKGRMRLAGDKKPRIFFLQDSLIERDQDLASRKLPTCSEEEIESYVWATNAAGIKEVPVDANNHGQDCTRYVVAHFDLVDRRTTTVSIPGF